jgi:hypothetical protein
MESEWRREKVEGGERWRRKGREKSNLRLFLVRPSSSPSQDPPKPQHDARTG